MIEGAKLFDKIIAKNSITENEIAKIMK